MLYCAVLECIVKLLPWSYNKIQIFTDGTGKGTGKGQDRYKSTTEHFDHEYVITSFQEHLRKTTDHPTPIGKKQLHLVTESMERHL